MKQSEFLAVTSKLLKAREKPSLQGAFGFGFLLIGSQTGARFLRQ